MHWLTLTRWLAVWMLVSMGIDYFRALPPSAHPGRLNHNEQCLLSEFRGGARCPEFVPPEPTPGTKLAFALARWSWETSVFALGTQLWCEPKQVSSFKQVGQRHFVSADGSCHHYFTKTGGIRGCCPLPCNPFLVPTLR